MLVVNLYGCMGHLARNNRMLGIFSIKKKGLHGNTNVSPFRYCIKKCILMLLCILILFWHVFFSQSFAVAVMLFEKCYFFFSCFHLFFWSRAFHPQFATSYFLFWMPCYRCKQRITVFWASDLQQHFN